MNVLSLFDGISCGHLALDRAGIKVDNYYASEIDKYTIQITNKNYPNTMQLGDILGIHLERLPKIDLLIGGSPCQGFSLAGKQLNFNDPRSVLFFEYVKILDILREINPDIKFLLENVKMKKEYQDVISDLLGVEPIEINSSLVSAQNRKRLYWTNIKDVTKPEDKGILLRDILLEEDNKNFEVVLGAAQRGRNIVDGKRRDYLHAPTVQRIEINGVEKSNCISTVLKDSLVYVQFQHPTDERVAYIERRKNSGFCKGIITNLDIKAPCLTASMYKNLAGHTILPENGVIRFLHPIECERLQTIPDNYTEGVSDTQRYKMLGNGWTVDVLAHIFKNLKYE